MRAVSLIAAAFIASVAAPVDARPSYLFVDERGDGSHAIFLDLDSIKRHAPKVEYWMLQVNLAPTATKPRFVSHALRSYTDDCDAGTSQMRYAIIYTVSGEPLSRGPVKNEPEPIVPDSVGDEIRELLCHGKAPSFSIVHSVEEARALGRQLRSKLPKR